MKQWSIISGRLSVGVFICSLVFSACSSMKESAKLCRTGNVGTEICYQRRIGNDLKYYDVEQFGRERGSMTRENVIIDDRKTTAKIRALTKILSDVAFASFDFSMFRYGFLRDVPVFETASFRRKMPFASKSRQLFELISARRLAIFPFSVNRKLRLRLERENPNRFTRTHGKKSAREDTPPANLVFLWPFPLDERPTVCRLSKMIEF